MYTFGFTHEIRVLKTSRNGVNLSAPASLDIPFGLSNCRYFNICVGLFRSIVSLKIGILLVLSDTE